VVGARIGAFNTFFKCKRSIGEMTEISKASITKLSQPLAENKPAVTMHVVDENSAGQRIDNFLARVLKGVPKSHIYRILRSGEVRVNSKRVEASYKLAANDAVRVPPVRIKGKPAEGHLREQQRSKLDQHIIFEDDALLVIDKPAGFAVHGGSGISRGIIEQLRLERPRAKFLELVHRLDRETSGVLLLAKKRSALVALHEAIRNNQTDKRYVMLAHGDWTEDKKRVRLPLHKYVLPSGERRVAVQEDGQHSETLFYLRKRYGEFSLLEAKLVTGRTHQLRVQLSHLGHPIVGDGKYGDFNVNKLIQKRGLKRMFLHSAETTLKHPLTGEKLKLVAPLPAELRRFLESIEPGSRD
jgi:23S rRNA pseudouridine955/2504/2580 synthase